MPRHDPLKVRLEDLKKIRALEPLSDRRLRHILPFCRKRLLAKNTVIFLEDEPAYHLYFLQTGSVTVILSVGGEVKHTVYKVEEGQSFGWSAVVAPYLFSATTLCVEPSIVIEMDAVALRKHFDKDHKTGYIFMTAMARVVSQRLLDSRRSLLEALSQPVREHATAAVD